MLGRKVHIKDLSILMGRGVTVHGKSDLKRGLLNGIFNELNINVEELIKFLKK